MIADMFADVCMCYLVSPELQVVPEVLEVQQVLGVLVDPLHCFLGFLGFPVFLGAPEGREVLEALGHQVALFYLQGSRKKSVVNN